MESASPYLLIAEPHAPTARALTQALSAVTGLPCEVAADGVVAHEILLRRGLPRGVVTNLVLPRRDGFAVLRTLRKLDRERTVMSVAYSAIPEIHRTAENFRHELGPLRVLLKPTPEAIVRAFQQPRSASERPPAPRPPVASVPAAPPPEPVPAPRVYLSPPPPEPSPAALPRPARAPEAAPSALRHRTAPLVAPPPALAPPPSPQAQREARMEALEIFDDSPPDAELQQIVANVARSFGVSTAMVTMVLESKLWFKSYFGLEGQALRERSIPSSVSFCHHVAAGGEMLVVPDAREHPTFAQNAMVRSGEVGSYAGAPIVTPQGEVLGALCIVDSRPLAAGPAELEQLRLIARRVAGEIELSAARKREARLAANLPELTGPASRTRTAPLPASDDTRRLRLAALASLTSALSPLPCGIALFDANRRLLFANEAFHRLFDLRPGEMIGARRPVVLARVAELFADPADGLSRLATPDEGPAAFHAQIELRAPFTRSLSWSVSPVDVPGGAVEQLAVTVVDLPDA